MATTSLPPIGSVWVCKANPHDMAIVLGYETVLSNKPNVVRFHRTKTNTVTQDTIGTFTWIYKPLETK
jgi:hypothetical protein